MALQDGYGFDPIDFTGLATTNLKGGLAPGQQLGALFALSIGDSGSSGGKPVIALVSPTQITVPSTTPWVYRVTDTVALQLVAVAASYSDRPGLLEVVHDGATFGPSYQGATNQRLSISGGYELHMLRDGGFPGTPTFKWFVVDKNGHGP